MGEIRFHLKSGPFGFLSNFYALPRPLSLDGKDWPTSEHYYQAQKFADTDPELAEAIRTNPSPYRAWTMAAAAKARRRPDWGAVADGVMLAALRAKFSDRELAAMLLNTADKSLVEHAPNDRYWGDGGDGSGLNRLGELLMQVRSEIRAGGLRVEGPGHAGSPVPGSDRNMEPLPNQLAICLRCGKVRVDDPPGWCGCQDHGTFEMSRLRYQDKILPDELRDDLGGALVFRNSDKVVILAESSDTLLRSFRAKFEWAAGVEALSDFEEFAPGEEEDAPLPFSDAADFWESLSKELGSPDFRWEWRPCGQVWRREPLELRLTAKMQRRTLEYPAEHGWGGVTNFADWTVRLLLSPDPLGLSLVAVDSHRSSR